MIIFQLFAPTGQETKKRILPKKSRLKKGLATGGRERGTDGSGFDHLHESAERKLAQESLLCLDVHSLYALHEDESRQVTQLHARKFKHTTTHTFIYIYIYTHTHERTTTHTNAGTHEDERSEAAPG
jgi:hypothetical protein